MTNSNWQRQFTNMTRGSAPYSLTILKGTEWSNGCAIISEILFDQVIERIFEVQLSLIDVAPLCISLT